MAEATSRFGLVAAQLASLAWIGWRAGKAWPWPEALLAVVIASGAWLLWAWRSLGDSLTPDPKPNARGLKTGGPYRWVRHPMYLGLLVPSVGLALIDPLAWWGVAPLAAALAGKVRLEERMLRAAYPEFEEYARRSWRLIPFVW
ncbi:MAG: isoprenylcysteine carboxylmethyltransferase family protein [Fimbriimonadales bacterium]|nr:isoprenylcysteine carboxylmethyltransferase family protein [Fimbriimonadales bacterium]